MYFLKSTGLSIRRALYIAHYVKKDVLEMQ